MKKRILNSLVFVYMQKKFLIIDKDSASLGFVIVCCDVLAARYRQRMARHSKPVDIFSTFGSAIRQIMLTS